MQSDMDARTVETLLAPANRELRDGYEVHQAALARGLDVRLLPRQVMEVSIPGDAPTTVGFSHGVPETTTLAGATYAQDLRMRRAMLSKAGYTQPRGATFSVGRSQNLARRFADRIGYPVVLKPAVGDNTIEVAANLLSRHDLIDAVRYLYTPPSKRENFTRAAYALTELREPGRVNGKIVAPPGYRFLVEKHLRGQYLRFIVIDRQVRNVLYCPKGPWESSGDQIQDVTASTHESLKEAAIGAANAIPGLAVVALDMIVRDFKQETPRKRARIVELSERPWLAVQHQANPELAIELADEILASAVPQALDRPRQGTIATEVLISGAVDPNRLLQALQELSDELGIRAQLRESDHVLGQLRGTVHGRPANIAWLMERLLDGGIKGQRAMMVDQRALQNIVTESVTQ